MTDIDKILRAWKRCRKCNTSMIATLEERESYIECEYTIGIYCGKDRLIDETIALLEEQSQQLRPAKQHDTYWCAKCGCHLKAIGLNIRDNYCRNCGTKVLWNGDENV